MGMKPAKFFKPLDAVWDRAFQIMSAEGGYETEVSYSDFRDLAGNQIGQEMAQAGIAPVAVPNFRVASGRTKDDGEDGRCLFFYVTVPQLITDAADLQILRITAQSVGSGGYNFLILDGDPETGNVHLWPYPFTAAICVECHFGVVFGASIATQRRALGAALKISCLKN